MISSDEIRRIAGRLNVDPMVVNRDYVLGCFLRFLGKQEVVQQEWLFKGGTALAKCYFPNFRFSEDLDFTVTGALTPEGLVRIADDTTAEMQNDTGIQTDIVPTRIEVLNDDYGKESFEVRIYYRGPWQSGGSPPSLRIHAGRDELISFPPLRRTITHPYSDNETLPHTKLKTYALEEVFAENLRAISGQRRNPIARDIFDLYFLSENGANAGKATEAFPAKCKVKGINPQSIDVEKIRARKDEFRTNWESNLEYLVPVDLRIAFEKAWNVAISHLSNAVSL